jgi:DnaJ-class molecular chaperone
MKRAATTHTRLCPHCNGEGTRDGEPRPVKMLSGMDECPHCHGRGTVRRDVIAIAMLVGRSRCK